MAKYFKTAFAKNGDRATVPDNTQVDGSVSFEQGYGIDYERDQETDPQAKDIGRESFNGLFHDMTEAVGEIQSSGVAQWISGIKYPKGALVWRNKVLHLSIVDANTSAPPSDKWTILYDKSNTTVDKNNFIRAEGNKTTVVTDDITHDVNETSREKVASADLVSKKITGGNVVHSTGRSTVDVISQNAYTNLTFGSEQSLIDVTSRRSWGVVYTNDTSKPIFITIVVEDPSGGNLSAQLIVDNKLAAHVFTSSGFIQQISCIVPQGKTYILKRQDNNDKIISWLEFK